jgi:hypothetical protein
MEVANFERQVAAVLAAGGFRVVENAYVGGARVDFLVYQEDLPLAALEMSAPSDRYATEKLSIKRRFTIDYAHGLSGLPVLIVVPDRLERLAFGDIVPFSRLLDRLGAIVPRVGHAQAQALIQPAAADTTLRVDAICG